MPPDPVQVHADTIAEIHHEVIDGLGAHQRVIERLTGWIGRPRALYLIVLLLMAWVGANTFLAIAWDRPPFPILQGIVGALGLLVATMVLTTQNRLARHNERRAQLDLHINLLAEQRSAKIIQLIEELRRDLPSVKNRHDPEAEALQAPSDAREVMATLNESLDAKR